MSQLRIAALAAALVLPSAMPLAAQDSLPRQGVTVSLRYDPTTKPGIAVLPIGGEAGDSVRTIVERDLDYSDRFIVVQLQGNNPAAFRTAAGGGVNYPLFAKLGAVAVVEIAFVPTGLHVALLDVAKGAEARSADFALTGVAFGADWRMSVHRVSDEIEQWITGRPGIASSRVAFVRGPEVRVVDSDGWGEHLVPVRDKAVSPGWNPNGNMLVYSTYGVGSRIVLHDLRTGRDRILGATPGNTNLSPVFSPDGTRIVYSHADDSGSDLYTVSLSGDDSRRISVGRGSDNAQPSFSPDGRRIAFTSGRLGHPEIYIMDADGSNAELLTSFDFGDQNYRSDPDWSPDGRLIAFQSQFAGRFQLMTISLRDRSTKLLTSEGANEEPSWAPDGRHLVFTSTRSGARQLWVLDSESGRMRQLTHGAGSRLAAWSPRFGDRRSQ